MTTRVDYIVALLEGLDPMEIERTIGAIEEWHDSRNRIGLACVAMSEGLRAMATLRVEPSSIDKQRLCILHEMAEGRGYVSPEYVEAWSV